MSPFGFVASNNSGLPNSTRCIAKQNETLTFDVENTVLNIYVHFSMFPSRKEQMKDSQVFMEIESLQTTDTVYVVHFIYFY